MKKPVLLSLAFSLLIAGCANNSRYHLAEDAHPDTHPHNIEQISDAKPKFEPFSAQGNKTYSVRGKTYQVMNNPQNFSQQGFASWYGKKFHGHLTSNGETYDMFTMSAAHKTLPIPCYVRVKNLQNQKEVVVRVNDRGPFHDGRVIDLSYAAARKLGVYQTGTAQVEVSYIHVTPDNPNHQHHAYYIQVAAGSKRENLESLGKSIQERFDYPYMFKTEKDFIKLHAGPFRSLDKAETVLSNLQNEGYPDSYLVKTNSTL